MAFNLEVNKEICIRVGGAVCHSAVAVSLLFGEVVVLKEKAVQLKVEIKNKDYFLWLPLSALKETKGKYDTYYVLATWFKGNRYQNFILTNAETSFLSTSN